MSFNTVEDVNGAMFDNQGFWWYELDTVCIDPTGDAEFSNVTVDFLTISRENITTATRKYTIVVDNDLWTKRLMARTKNYGIDNVSLTSLSDSSFEMITRKSASVLMLYMGNIPYSEINSSQGYLWNSDCNLMLPYNEIGQEKIVHVHTGGSTLSIPFVADIGYNRISYNDVEYGYVYVKLLKTDFQFTCNQQLIVGEVNTVQLGTDTDYKVGGDLVGDYETKLSVLYNGETLPVTWNETLNDYTFDLDLTDKTTEGKIRFKVIVEANEVLNASETDVALDCKFETIDTLAKLTELFRIGGVGRLGANLTLTNDLTLTKSVNLIGNDCSIDMANHKISVGSDLTFKAQTVNFSNGVNSIQQEPNSNVELYDCTFTDCTGFGSVIDCQVDLASLDETDDFTTRLTDCTISDCDMAILHGGNLEVTRCNVNGKISNKNYPFFLYQTDGNAVILNSEFNLTDNTVYDYDIEFNSCIFTCGETATVNGYSHTELQNNNMSAFFDTQRNTSTIDVQYYYSLIEANVHLQSNKGYCHSVSGVDYIFKSNVTITRGE